MSTDLLPAKFSEMTLAIERMNTPKDGLAVFAMADAMAAYAKRIKASTETQNAVVTFRLRAERKLGQILLKLPKAKPRSGKGQKKTDRRFRNGIDGPDTLKELEIPPKVSSRAQCLARVPEPKFEKELVVEDGEELDGNRIAAALVRDVKRVVIRTRLDTIAAAQPKTPTGLFDVIVVDPPWPMEKIERDERPNQSSFDYPTMTVGDIEDMTMVRDFAASDCHVFLWTTQKFLPDSFQILDRWTASYVFTMVWHKPGGFQPVNLPQFNCEFCLYGRIGNPQFLDTKAFSTCFQAPRTKHSEKPDEFYALLRRVTAGRRLDAFNRRKIEEFVGWGKEAQ